MKREIELIAIADRLPSEEHMPFECLVARVGDFNVPCVKAAWFMPDSKKFYVSSIFTGPMEFREATHWAELPEPNPEDA